MALKLSPSKLSEVFPGFFGELKWVVRNVLIVSLLASPNAFFNSVYLFQHVCTRI